MAEKMMNPKFSIIIPNYNKGILIKNCLNSIFNQTINKEEYEVIIIDDASTDNSLDYINGYDVVLLKSNRLGAGGARNCGFEVAKGAYIILLENVLKKTKRIESENYYKKIENLYNWIESGHAYTYEQYLNE